MMQCAVVASVEGDSCLMNATHTYGPPLRLLVPSFQSDVNVFKKKKENPLKFNGSNFFCVIIR